MPQSELPRLTLRQKQRVSVVAPLPAAVQLPTSCANCGETAGTICREQNSGRDLLIPYCTRCFADVNRQQTFSLASGVAALILGVTLLLIAPRLFSKLGIVDYTLLCALPAFVPPAMTALFTLRRKSTHNHGGRAAWLTSANRLLGTREAWINELCQINNLTSTQTAAREPTLGVAPFFGSLIALAAAPLLYSWFFPSLLVLNLTAPEFELWIDGAPQGRVEPSSLESQEVGLRLHLAAGRHVFEARSVAPSTPAASRPTPDEGASAEVLPLSEPFLIRREATLSAGGNYLFAPASDDFCFWLETDFYGRNARPQQRQVLPAGQQFWELPSHLDAWFGKNPDPGADRVSTGGQMTALRQDRCIRVLERTGSAP